MSLFCVADWNHSKSFRAATGAKQKEIQATTAPNK